MAFADWKKRTTAFERYLPRGYHAMAELVAHAAYKAGERDGRKQAEAVAEQAIKLRELMRSNALAQADAACGVSPGAMG